MCAILLSCESKFVVVHNKKTCRESGSVDSFLMNVGTRRGWVNNFTPQGSYPHYILNSRVDYTQSHSGQFVEQMEMTQPGIENCSPVFLHLASSVKERLKVWNIHVISRATLDSLENRLKWPSQESNNCSPICLLLASSVKERLKVWNIRVISRATLDSLENRWKWPSQESNNCSPVFLLLASSMKERLKVWNIRVISRGTLDSLENRLKWSSQEPNNCSPVFLLLASSVKERLKVWNIRVIDGFNEGLWWPWGLQMCRKFLDHLSNICLKSRASWLSSRDSSVTEIIWLLAHNSTDECLQVQLNVSQ